MQRLWAFLKGHGTRLNASMCRLLIHFPISSVSRTYEAKVESPGPFEANRSISDQTLAALEAAMVSTRDSETQAFWIDAICVPAEGAR